MLLAYVYTSYLSAAMPTAPTAQPSYCVPALPSAVYADMHDGDQKRVTTSADGTLSITPFGNSESWSVTAAIDQRFCNATIDFNVPGKPNPPPCNLTLSFEQLLRPNPSTGVGALVFTDPSEPRLVHPCVVGASTPSPPADETSFVRCRRNAGSTHDAAQHMDPAARRQVGGRRRCRGPSLVMTRVNSLLYATHRPIFRFSCLLVVCPRCKQMPGRGEPGSGGSVGPNTGVAG